MVALVIMILAVGALFDPFTAQYAGYNRETAVQKVQETAQSCLLIIQRDIMMAGYGVDKQLSFYVQDGGDGNPDRLIINDSSFVGEDELLQGIYGQTDIVSKSAYTLTLPSLNIDRLGSDDSYGGDSAEFAGGKWQYIITNTTAGAQKIARVMQDNDATTITLDRYVSGTRLAPAIYYCVDFDGSDSACHPGSSTDSLSRVLRRSDRASTDLQALAGGIVDLQVAYRDTSSNWYCDGTGSCPLISFNPEDIDLLRVTIIARTNPMRRLVKGDAVQAENGATWSDGDHVYRTYTAMIRPRNTSI